MFQLMTESALYTKEIYVSFIINLKTVKNVIRVRKHKENKFFLLEKD